MLVVAAALVGLGALAVMAFVGLAMIIVGRLRERRTLPFEPAHPSPALAPDSADLLDRRAQRSARVRLPEDPIVAALGVGDPGKESPPRPHLDGDHLPSETDASPPSGPDQNAVR
jgi:hypothetical protein